MDYKEQVEVYIKKEVTEQKYHDRVRNYSTLENYWNIGRLIVEAQGGETRAKYGNGLIKEWSKDFTEKYGKGYDATNLRKMRQFYLIFPKCATLWRTLTWSIIRVLLPIKDENRRNYLINLCITNSLSVRQLQVEIKNNSYERLIDKPEHIEIISPKNEFSLTSDMKSPIIIKVDKNKKIKTEKDLETLLLSELAFFFSQLGQGFMLAGNQYKVCFNNKDYYIDILLFNVNYNCYVAVKLKLRELRKEDKAQVEFYMQLIDNQIKLATHNKTIGIIISKEQDQFIASFIKCENIIPITYELQEN